MNREQLSDRPEPQGDRLDVLARTCDRCAQQAADCITIDDAYICGDCRAEIAAEEAEVEALRQQLRGAVEEIERLRGEIAGAVMTMSALGLPKAAEALNSALDATPGQS